MGNFAGVAAAKKGRGASIENGDLRMPGAAVLSPMRELNFAEILNCSPYRPPRAGDVVQGRRQGPGGAMSWDRAAALARRLQGGRAFRATIW